MLGTAGWQSHAHFVLSSLSKLAASNRDLHHSSSPSDLEFLENPSRQSAVLPMPWLVTGLLDYNRAMLDCNRKVTP